MPDAGRACPPWPDSPGKTWIGVRTRGGGRHEVLRVPEVPHRAAPAGDRPGRREQVAT